MNRHERRKAAALGGTLATPKGVEPTALESLQCTCGGRVPIDMPRRLSDVDKARITCGICARRWTITVNWKTAEVTARGGHLDG